MFEGLQIGQYRLQRLVGRGSTGEVYLADDQRIKRQVALKLVQIEDSSSESVRNAARLFEREAKTIAVLNHPNILPLFDFGEEMIEESRYAYLVTPFCPEGSLSAWLHHRQRNGVYTLLPYQALHIVEIAADALEYAHDQQVIHRDVKPSNFLVRSRKDAPDQPNLLLADFGIARLSEGTINASKTIRGTPKYMSPEQWRGRAEPATDQYALAVMTYELLTGRSPFTGPAGEMMYQHLMNTPQPPSTHNPHLSPAIDAVIMRALTKQPEGRFPSIIGFASAFRQAVLESSAAANLPETFSSSEMRLSLNPPSSPDIRMPSNPPSSPDIRISSSSPSSPDIRVPSNPDIRISSNPPWSPDIRRPANPSSSPDIRVPVSYPAALSERDTPSISMGAIEAVPDFYTTLTLSSTEALAGINRTLTLPGQQHVTIAIPAGVYHGQVIRMEGQVASPSPGMRKGDLFVKIAVTPAAEPVVTESIPGLPAVSWKRYLLFGLALLVLVPGLIGLSYFGINQLSGQKTPTPVVSSNHTNTGTHSVQASSTATSANVNAQATAQANATAAAGAYSYDYQPKALVLNDPLERNSSAKWDETSGACTFTAGGYQVTGSPQATGPQVCIAHTPNFNDFTFEVQMKVLKGSGGGILFRSTGSASYYFRLEQSGNLADYTLSACAGAGTSCNRILSSGFTSEFIVGQANTIAVVAKGNSIEFYVNDSRIGGIPDNTSLRGQIGLVAEPGSEIAFSDAKVWTL